MTLVSIGPARAIEISLNEACNINVHSLAWNQYRPLENRLSVFHGGLVAFRIVGLLVFEL